MRPLAAAFRLAAVTLALVGALRGLDAVPRLLTGLPRGVVAVRSLSDARALTGAPVTMPSYFPSALDWPPRDISVYRGQEVGITVRERSSGLPWLVIAGGPAAWGGISPNTLGPVTVLQDSEATQAGRPVHVQRVQDRTGAVWHQVSWHEADRTMVVRYRGALDELLRIAGSLRAGSSS